MITLAVIVTQIRPARTGFIGLHLPDSVPFGSAAQWSAAADWVTVCIAVAAALFAFFQVREARRLRVEQAKPFVVVDIQTSGANRHVLNLVVENTGPTLARDVTFEFNPPLATSRTGYDLAETVFIKTGLPMIPPHRRQEFLFDHSVNRREANLPMRYDVIVRYSDQNGKQQDSLRFPIDLTPLYGMRYVEEKGVHQIATALETVAGQTKKWTKQNGLRVWVRDEDAELERDRIEWGVFGDTPFFGRQPPPESLMWALRFPPFRAIVGGCLGWIRRRRQPNS